ncbi:MAG TPA: 5-dehydro-4-deoxy-D-glucuronate isomerase [Cyclobacteriaceae bacterium]|nr:5-dehydro-4-deoxy-D-glucuronate isomerase [Cyclobacteriaceae bacterium]
MSSISSRHAVHPGHFQAMTTQAIREHFLIENIFVAGTVQNTYTHYDRLIVGGAMPIHQPLKLEPFSELKAEFYLQRRELGIINVGAPGTVKADGNTYALNNKEALYIGRGVKDVTFESMDGGQSYFYFNSAPAHATHPNKKVSSAEAETVELGNQATSNHRTIRKLLVNSVLTTCQLQMGLTELKPGSVWNTMPPHTHTRRMEAYFYFEVPEGQAICHMMGQANETRHVWLKNHQAVLSPPWSIHSGVGTANYSFIWGMAGENLDYADMDAITIPDIR